MCGLDQRKPTTGVWPKLFISSPINKLLKRDTKLLHEAPRFCRLLGWSFQLSQETHNENSFRRSKRDPKLFTFSERSVDRFWRESWLKRKQPLLSESCSLESREASREGSRNETQFFCLCSGGVCVIYRLVYFNSQSIHISWLSRTNIADVQITLPWGHHGQFIDWWKRHFPSPAYFSNREWRLHCTGHESRASASLGVTEVSNASLSFVRFLETE